MLADHAERFKDAPWSEHKLNITIGGAGGLGSWIALLLARIGHSLRVYDMDVVGGENIGGGQIYGPTDIGTPKVSALKNIIHRFVGPNSYQALDKFENGDAVSNITIATFDNMEARMDMLETWYKHLKDEKEKGNTGPFAFIDGRMLPQGGQVFVVDRPSRIQRWKEDWRPSSEVPDLPCTFKSTTHSAVNTATQVVSILNNIVSNKMVFNEDFLEVPFKVEMDLAGLLYQKTA